MGEAPRRSFASLGLLVLLVPSLVPAPAAANDPCDPYGGRWPDCNVRECDPTAALCCPSPTSGTQPFCTGTPGLAQQLNTRRACAIDADPPPAAVQEDALPVAGVLSWQEPAGPEPWYAGCAGVFFTQADVCVSQPDPSTFVPQRGVLCGPWVTPGNFVACRLEGEAADDPSIGIAFGWERAQTMNGLVSLAEKEKVQLAVHAGPVTGVRSTNPYNSSESPMARILVYPTRLGGNVTDPAAISLIACKVSGVSGSDAYAPEARSGVTPVIGIRPKPMCACGGEADGGTVNLGNGEAVFRFTPLFLRSDRGPSLSFNITYRSQSPDATHGALGPGFDFAYGRHLTVLSTGIRHHTGDGLSDFYRRTDAGYVSPPGVFATLEAASGGYDLVQPHGERDHYGATGLLERAKDRNGNAFHFSYDGGRLVQIVDAQGREATLAYDALSGLLTEVVGVSGLKAGFDYTDGRLTKVTTTPSLPAGMGPATRFTWNGDDLLASVADPKGDAYWSTSYTAGSTPGRWLATSQNDGAGTHSYAYDFDRLQTTTTDPVGNVVVTTFQDATHLFPIARWIKPNGADPDDKGGNWTYAYNADGLVTEQRSPRGVRTDYEYDSGNAERRSQANLLARTTRPAKPNATPFDGTYEAVRARHKLPDPQQPIVVTYTYEPSFNQIETVVEERGNDPTHVPPNGGGGGPERYKTRHLFDERGNVVQVIRPVAHLNGAPNPLMSAQASAQASIETYAYNEHGQVVSRTDAAGTRTDFTYYPSNGASHDPYDLEGYLQSKVEDVGEGTDPATGEAYRNLRTEYEHTPFGVVTKSTDPAGVATEFEVNPRCVVTGFTMDVPNPPKVDLSYDENDRVTNVTTALQESPPLSQTKLAFYDARGKMILQSVGPNETVVGDAIRATTYVYDDAGNLVQKNNPDGGVEHWAYDQRGLPVEHAFSGFPPEVRRYDADGNLVKVIDPTGNVTRHVRDGFGRERAIVSPEGSVTFSFYDAAGRVVATFRMGGGAAQAGIVSVTTSDETRLFAYDERGRLYQEDTMVDPLVGPLEGPLTPGDQRVSSITEHDVRDRVVRTLNDNGHKVDREYDALGRESVVTDEMGNRVESTYDEQGNRIEKREVELGSDGLRTFTTLYGYDAVGRQVNETSPSGGFTTRDYDLGGRVVGQVNPDGSQENWTYDSEGRVRSHTLWRDATDNITVRTVYALRGPAQQTDALNRSTFTTYDAHGWKTSETHPDGTRTNWTYNARGDAIRIERADGTIVHQSFDRDGRLRFANVTRAPGVVGTTQQEFQYDRMGRVILLRDDNDDRNATVLRSYDGLGNLRLEWQDGLLVERAFDGLGAVTSLTYPDGRTLRYASDPLERLAAIEDGDGHAIATYAYAGPSRLVAKVLGNGATSLRAYDDGRRLVSIEDAHALGLVAGFDYTHDARDRVASAASRHDPGHGSTYALDGAGRLVAWDRGEVVAGTLATPSPDGWTGASWTLDKAHNWDAYATTGAGVASETRTHGANHQLTAITQGAATATQTFDLNGNLQSDGTFEYAYDFKDRLKEVRLASGGLVARYDYDAEDRRVLKMLGQASFSTTQRDPTRVLLDQLDGPTQAGETVADALNVPEDTTTTYTQAKATVRYVHAGPNAIQESDVNGTALRQFVYGRGIDELVAMDPNPILGPSRSTPPQDRIYYHLDHLGSVVALTDATGAVVERYEHSPYGETLACVGCDGAISGVGNPYRYTARTLDDETGLYYYRARYYAAEQGRFISRDPIGTWGDAANLGNGYAYVGSLPFMRTDPTGKDSTADPGCGGGGRAYCNQDGRLMAEIIGQDLASEMYRYNLAPAPKAEDPHVKEERERLAREATEEERECIANAAREVFQEGASTAVEMAADVDVPDEGPSDDTCGFIGQVIGKMAGIALKMWLAGRGYNV